MNTRLLILLPLLLVTSTLFAQDEDSVARPERIGHGLRGYISSHAETVPETHRYGAGFYAGVWSLVPEPIAGFQIGLPSAWIIPNNDDNPDVPLCPVGTTARDNWPERGPTYGSVFQTLEGGIGYWAGNRFHYGPPKFSMNATSDCYSHEIASPGWPFFHSSGPLPDDLLGIAQISNRILVPPDGMTFKGTPMGELLGYAYMALPLTDEQSSPQPTGTNSWTLFINAKNFKGPVACYVPETWSRIAHDYPFDVGRGLDARGSTGGLSGAMEINTVPRYEATDSDGVSYARIPQLQFPVDARDRTTLVRDTILYSKDAIYDEVLAWRDGGRAPDGRFKTTGMIRPKVGTGPIGYRIDDTPISGINELAQPSIFSENTFGLTWTNGVRRGVGRFPTFYRLESGTWKAVDVEDVPAETGLREASFAPPGKNPRPYSALPLAGSWATPGPAAGPFESRLADGSTVTYHWYRFVDQPVFQQYDRTEEEMNRLQAMIERMHSTWRINGTYLAPPSAGRLVSFDPNLIVSPPKGMEVGYVPIVTHQAKTVASVSESSLRPAASSDGSSGS